VNIALEYRDSVDMDLILPRVNWRNAQNELRPSTLAG
jgi:hypothetical protein